MILRRFAWYALPILGYITLGALFYAFSALMVKTAWAGVSEMAGNRHELEGWALYLPALFITMGIMPGRVRGAYEKVPRETCPLPTDGILTAGAIRKSTEEQK